MDLKLLKKVRDAIEDPVNDYSQSRYWIDRNGLPADDIREIEGPSGDRFCGSPFCIAGHIVAQAGWDRVRKESTGYKVTTIHAVAQRLLGIDTDQADLLFNHEWPYWDEWGTKCHYQPEREDAVVALDRIIKDGEIHDPDESEHNQFKRSTQT